MTFQKGQVSNPRGRPKMAKTVLHELAEFRRLARRCAPEAMRKLMAMLRDDELKQEVRVTATRLLLEWAFGKPENAQEVVGGPQEYAALPLTEQARHLEAALIEARRRLVAEGNAKAPDIEPAAEHSKEAVDGTG